MVSGVSSLGAAPSSNSAISAAIVHRRRERGKFDRVDLASKRRGVDDLGFAPDDGARS